MSSYTSSIDFGWLVSSVYSFRVRVDKVFRGPPVSCRGSLDRVRRELLFQGKWFGYMDVRPLRDRLLYDVTTVLLSVAFSLLPGSSGGPCRFLCSSRALGGPLSGRAPVLHEGYSRRDLRRVWVPHRRSSPPKTWSQVVCLGGSLALPTTGSLAPPTTPVAHDREPVNGKRPLLFKRPMGPQGRGVFR